MIICDNCGKKMGPSVATRYQHDMELPIIGIENKGNFIFNVCFECNNMYDSEMDNARKEVETRWSNKLFERNKDRIETEWSEFYGRT